MIVYFLRHASAGEHLANPEEGRKTRARQRGHRAVRLHWARAGRARCAGGRHRLQSAEALPRRPRRWWAMRLGYEGKLQIDAGAAPAGRTSPISASCWRSMPSQEAMMVVGHNPNLSQFLGTVISDSGCEASLELKKGAVAKVEMRRSSGTLAVVPHAEDCCARFTNGRGKFPPEDFPEIVALFFDRPKFQIHSHSAARHQRQLDSRRSRTLMRTFSHGAAAAEIHGARQAQQQEAFCTFSRSCGSRSPSCGHRRAWAATFPDSARWPR